MDSLPRSLLQELIVERDNREISIIGRQKSTKIEYESNTGVTGDILRNIFTDNSNMNLKQKERIAQAVLSGNYMVRTNNKPRQIEHTVPQHMRTKTMEQANKLRFNQKLKTLELKSNAACLHPITMKEAKLQETNRLNNYTSNCECSWGPNRVELHPPTTIGVKTTFSIDERQREYLIEANAAARIMNLQHKVSEVKSVKSLASDDADARERQLKIAFAKKITSFRKKLVQRLRERKDPQASDIMRTIDDAAIYDFISNFKGCAMTIDAVLYHLGSNLCGRQASVHERELNSGFQGASLNSMDLTEEIFEDVDPPSLPLPRSRSPELQVHDSAAPPLVSSQVDKKIVTIPRSLKMKAAGFRSVIKPKSPKKISLELHSPSPLPPPSPQHFGNSRPESPSDRAISAVRNELIAKGSLQSLQPKIALSQDQLDDLASGALTFERIARQVKLDFTGGDLKTVPIANTKAPFLKSKHSSSDDELHRLQRIGASKGLRTGSASGASKPRSLQTRDYDGLYVMTSAKPSLEDLIL